MSDIVRDTSAESMARANEANLAQGLAACALAYGGEVIDEPDLLWCYAGFPAAGFNRVPRADLAPEMLDNRIEWVKARAQALRTPFLWSIGASMRPANLGEALLRHGLSDAGEESAMGVVLANLPDVLPLPAGVTVERMADRAGLDQWARTMGAGFGVTSASDTDMWADHISRDTFGDGAAAYYYLARLHGTPVATAGLTTAGGVAGIFSVTTIEPARRQGIGTAVTMAPLLDARARGYIVGVLQASEMGYPVYARMGFTEQFRYHDYIWRPD